MINLLKNPGFETDWGEQSSHWVEIFNEDGSSYQTMIGNIFTPANWMVWYKHIPDTWDQPEVRDAWKHVDARRVHSGEKATLFFTYYRNHDGGLYQQVEVSVGQELKFSAYCHAWSNHDGEGFPYPHNGLWSEGAGYNIVSWDAKDDEPDNGDQQHDAKRNFTFQVGIDPTGNTNPYSTDVVWSDGWHNYNGYLEPLSVEAVAQGELITVFLRSQTAFKFCHNDAYWDDCELIAVGEPEPCKGLPREQYKRTYVLTPPNMSLADKHRLLDIFPDNTIGPSADDAGLGDLDDKKVIAVDSYNWQDNLQDFFEQYYPGTQYEEYTLNPQPDKLLLWQCDPLWRDEKIAGSDCSKTLCQTGCWVACCAITQRYLGIDANATPSTVNQLLGSDGFTGCLTLWSAMKDKLQVEITKSTTTLSEVKSWVDSPDHCAFADVYWGEDMHFVFVEGLDNDGNLYCHDPYRNISGSLPNLYPDGAESYRLIKKVDDPTPPFPTTGPELISLHIQGNIPSEFDWLSWIEKYQPAAVKLVEGYQRCQEIKTRSPNTKVFIRRHHNNQGQFWQCPDGPERGAELFLATFGDDPYTLAPWIDGIEGMNEVIATGAPTIQQAIDFELAFGKLLQSEGLPPLCSPNAGVGNIGHDVAEIELFLPLVEHLIETGGYVGAHVYTGCRSDGYRSYVNNFIHYAGRPLLSWDEVFNAHGLYPYYLGTEGGPIYIATNGSMPSSGAGWKYSETLNNLEEYVEVLRQLRRKYITWNREHGWRFLVYELFTIGANDWPYFAHDAYTMNAIGAMIEEERAAGWK